MPRQVTYADLARLIAQGAAIRRPPPVVAPAAEPVDLDAVIAAVLARLPTPAPITLPAVVATPDPTPIDVGDTIEDLTYDERGRLRLKLKGGRLLEVRIAGTSTVVQTGSDGVQSIVAGDNVTVDNTDPKNPVVSATGGGGSLVESRYEIFEDEVITIPAGRNMLLFNGIINNGTIINGGRICEVAPP